MKFPLTWSSQRVPHQLRRRRHVLRDGCLSEPLRELSWLGDDRRKRAWHPLLHSISHGRGNDCCDSRAPRKHACDIAQEAELRQILIAMRQLAGTNPAMATVDLQDVEAAVPVAPALLVLAGGRGGAAAAPASCASGARSSSVIAVTSIEGLQRRRSRWPTAAHDRFACWGSRSFGRVLLENAHEARVSTYRGPRRNSRCSRKMAPRIARKTIAPKVDWTHYDGSLTGNRYSSLELINPSNVQRVGAAWVFPIASNPRALQSTPVVQDGIMYVTGWNEIYALDATTGRQLWTYSERARRHFNERRLGDQCGVTISGDQSVHVKTRASPRSTGSRDEAGDARAAHTKSSMLDIASTPRGRLLGVAARR